MQVSSDGRTWQTIARFAGGGSAQDVVTFAPRRVRRIRVSLEKASGATLPALEELSAR